MILFYLGLSFVYIVEEIYLIKFKDYVNIFRFVFLVIFILYELIMKVFYCFYKGWILYVIILLKFGIKKFLICENIFLIKF